MTDQPGRPPEERLPAPLPDESRVPAPADRFTAPPAIHRTAFTPERAAGIVRQSASARWAGFLAVTVVSLFVIGYYFYETTGFGGLFGVLPDQARLVDEEERQQVVSVERGYNVYQANCARCHGVNGEGGIGPALNVQEKLFAHLDETYLRNVLEVGGRYVCGNPDSLMPVWSDRNGGPLNYAQIEDLIAFIRAENTEEYEVRDPSLNEPTGEHFTGWRDPNYQPAPGATPYPECWLDALPGASGSPSPSGSPGPSGSPTGDVVTVSALNIAFEQSSLTAPADAAFTIDFENKDAGIPHNVEIKDSGNTSVYTGEIFNGVDSRQYAVPALPAGDYTFICTVHPNMTGTLTAGG